MCQRLQRVSKNVRVLLPFEPWGHIDHDGSECQCLSSDRTGAYIGALSIDQSPLDSVSSPLLSPDMAAGETLLCGEKTPGDASAGSVLFVSHQAGTYGRLLSVTYEHIKTGTLPACYWLTPVTRGAWRVAPPVDAGGWMTSAD